MNFCDKCGTLHTPDQCPHNPANATAESGPLLDAGQQQSLVDVASGMLNLGIDILTSLPSRAVVAAEAVGTTVTGAASSAVEVAGEALPAAAEAVGSGLGAVLEAGGAVLEGVGSVAGGVAEAAGDILSGL